MWCLCAVCDCIWSSLGVPSWDHEIAALKCEWHRFNIVAVVGFLHEFSWSPWAPKQKFAICQDEFTENTWLCKWSPKTINHCSSRAEGSYRSLTAPYNSSDDLYVCTNNVGCYDELEPYQFWILWKTGPFESDLKMTSMSRFWLGL